MVSGRSTTYALSLIFLRILYDPYFFGFSLLYVPIGNLSFLKNTITMSPSLNNCSLQCLSAAFLYLALVCSNFCLTFTCTLCTFQSYFSQQYSSQVEVAQDHDVGSAY